MKTNNNIPAYRFQGFEDDWEEVKLGEIGNTYAGLSGKTKDDFGHGEGRFVTYLNVFSNPISSPELVEAVEIDSRQNTVLYGDVLFTTSSETPEEVGMSSVWLENVENMYLNSFCFGFRPAKKVNSYYLAYLLRSQGMRKKISFLAQGISRYNISNNISKTKMMELEIFIPNEKEQSAIGTFFSTLDSQITLHQRKLDMLKEQKKTYLKLLFPAKGQTKPALRFQGFEDDWEEVKLGDVGETFTGLSGKTKEDFGHGEGKFITYVNVFNNPISDLLGTDKIEVDESQTSVQFGDIFFTTSSETPEEVGMSSVWLGDGDNIYLNSFCFGFRPTLKLSNHFMAYVLRSTVIRKKFIFLAQGISRYNISKTKVMNISIPLPTLPEQKAIGTFFQTLDQEIAQVEDKLASLKEMKKTLLRKLFVSWGMRIYHALPMSRSPSGTFLDCLSSQAVRREFF